MMSLFLSFLYPVFHWGDTIEKMFSKVGGFGKKDEKGRMAI